MERGNSNVQQGKIYYSSSRRKDILFCIVSRVWHKQRMWLNGDKVPQKTSSGGFLMGCPRVHKLLVNRGERRGLPTRSDATARHIYKRQLKVDCHVLGK